MGRSAACGAGRGPGGWGSTPSPRCLPQHRPCGEYPPDLQKFCSVTAAVLSALAVFTLMAHIRLGHIHDHLVEHIDRKTHQIEGLIIMSTQDIINAVVTQLGKAKDELLTQIADLNAQIANAGVAEQVDTTALTAAAQALDDIVPDAAPADPAA